MINFNPVTYSLILCILQITHVLTSTLKLVAHEDMKTAFLKHYIYKKNRCYDIYCILESTYGTLGPGWAKQSIMVTYSLKVCSLFG